ncbi:MAG: LysR family transcriptional regulator [Salinarimonas sp.]
MTVVQKPQFPRRHVPTKVHVRPAAPRTAKSRMGAVEMRGANWNDLRILLAVARAETMVAAARALGVDESTVARRLSILEAKIGAKLVARTPSGIRPTSEGAALLARLGRAEVEIETGLSAAAGADARVAGTVRITSVPVIVDHALAPALGALLSRHPDLTVELVSEAADLSVVQRQADIALRLARPERDQSALTRRIGHMRYGVYQARHARSGSEQGPNWIGLEGSRGRRFQARWIDERATVPPRAVATDVCTLGALVRAGLGIALLPIFFADNDPSLERLETDEPPPGREIWLLVRPEAREVARLATVVAWVEEIVATL